MLLPQDMAALNTMGHQTSQRRYPACARHQIIFPHIEQVWHEVMKIESESDRVHNSEDIAIWILCYKI